MDSYAQSGAVGVGLGLNSPAFAGDKKIPKTPPVRAIKDEFQAAQVAIKLQLDNRERNMRNQRIMAKYDAERPFVNDRLKMEGLDWKMNIDRKSVV